jgi:hypothetical protein
MRAMRAALLILALGVMAPPARAASPTPVGIQLGDMLAARERARLSGLVYSEVREAVEAGRRPAADLEAARKALKAAQVVVYDQMDAMTKSNRALMERLRADATRHVEEQQIRIAEEEKQLPTLGPDARPRAEDRLRMSRELLESYQRTVVSVRAPAVPKRPDLPVLPPRT